MDDIEGLAHEIWAVAQLALDEGIEDGVERIAAALRSTPVAAEIYAWQARFPQYEYRPQDGIVALSLDAPSSEDMRNALPPLPRPKYRMASSGIPSDGYSPEQMRDYALAARQPADLEALKAPSKSFAYRRDRLIEARGRMSDNDWGRASAFEAAHDELEAVLAADVPPAMTVPYGCDTADKGYAYGYAKGRADGWNAYRDEMLKLARLGAEKPSQE